MFSPSQRVLGAKYRLVRPLEVGGMGTVWLAEHLSLNSMVAVKLIAKEIAETEEGEQRFLREARTAASLRSPHVVQILDYGVDSGTPYIVMELLEGESLANRLERVRRLSPAQTELVVRHVARAVGRAHDAGIVHRDLKPANIFVVANEEEELVKVLDFGIAKSSAEWSKALAGRTRTGTFLGTPGYVSPEQAEGVKSLDHRTDIWSLGVIAFECLLGRPPFVGETFGSLLLAICSRPLPIPSEHWSVPHGFDEWFARACARDPEQRFSSAREASSELRRLLDLGGQQASGSGVASDASPPVDAPAPASAEPRPASARENPTPPAAPFVATGAASSSGVTRRREWARSRWPILASVLGGAALAVLVRSCLSAGVGERPLEADTLTNVAALAEAQPVTSMLHAGAVQEVDPASPKPAASATATDRSAAERASPIVAPVVAPPEPDALPVLGGGKPGASGRPLAAATTSQALRRARSIQSAKAGLKPAFERRPVSESPPRQTKPSSIDLGLGPPGPADCTPPWYVDEKGIRRLKPQCL